MAIKQQLSHEIEHIRKSGFLLDKRHTESIGLSTMGDDQHISPIFIKSQAYLPEFFNPAHHHDYINLCYCVNGSMEHFFDGHIYTQTDNTLIIVPPYTDHYLHNNDSATRSFRIDMTLDFLHDVSDIESADTMFSSLYFNPLMTRALAGSPIINLNSHASELVLEMYRLFSPWVHFPHKKIRANIVELLSMAAEVYVDRLSPTDRTAYENYRAAMKSSLSFINENYCKQITLDEVCKIALMSPARFLLLFKPIVGMGFTEYINYLRILNSRELLLSSERKIYDIAKTVGFSSDTYFYRAFKKHTGLTPAEFKKLYNSESAWREGDGGKYFDY